MNRFFLAALTILAIAPFTSTGAKAQEFNDAQKAEIKKMFDEYLLTSGDKILKSVNSYQAELEEKDRVEASKKAEGFIGTLKNKKDLPMAGNPDGDITMIEFFDYNCGYCRKALSEIKSVLKDDKNIKVIFMDMPILGPRSLEAAKWSLAANKQGKYFEYHQALLEHNGQKDDKVFEKLAKNVGLDVKQLAKDKDDKAIAKLLDDNIAQAQEIGIRGTPGFIVAGQIFPGFMQADRIKEIVAEARAK